MDNIWSVNVTEYGSRLSSFMALIYYDNIQGNNVKGTVVILVRMTHIGTFA